MKILLVAPMPPPHGGMAVSSVAIVNGMARRPEHLLEVVDISVRWRDPMDMRPLRRLAGGTRHAFSILRGVLSRARMFQPDVVEVANCGGIGPTLRDYFLLTLLRWRGVPTILTFHFGRIPAILARRDIESRLVRAASAAATCTVVLDRSTERALQALLGNRWIERRANFIDLERLERLARQGAARESECDVVFVGWMAREKGVFELMQAVKDMPGVRLKFVGPLAPATAEELWALAGDARGRVEHVGPVETDRVYGIIARARVLALPSHAEAFPYVVLEAMALQKPVVATTVAAIPDILDLHGAPCGIGAAVRDVAGLRAALERLLQDQTLCRVMGERGRERVRTLYTEATVMGEVVRQWHAVAKKGRARR